jgi:glycosyltransferase involved in cell wall biosynthesis
LLANDKAAGLENIVTVAETLASLGVPFRFSIVGSGPGESDLGRLIKRAGLESHFGFHGFVPIPQAYELIKDFDFGLVTWGDMPKNHLHTAMKVMDYMCCAVPVCSLLLKEQVRSTASIGIHAASFADIAKEIARLSSEPDEYEELRRRTLQHFNEELCWELQERKLLDAYRTLLDAEVGGDAPPCRSRTGP